MDDRRRVRVSKKLSLHLRHRPGALGLELAPGGWTQVDALLEALRARGFAIARAELDEVVAGGGSGQSRFELRDGRIRARYGHSVPIQLDDGPARPPAELFHGTAAHVVETIRRGGLVPMGRRYVHLSADVDSARRVGARHGRPVVLVIDAAGLAADGHEFWHAGSVWLTSSVPPERILQ